MATGIPTKTEKNKRKIPINISYDGKLSKDEILAKNFTEFNVYTTINKESNIKSENRFFYGDNLDVLLYLLHNGYKSKISLIYIDPPFATAGTFVNRNQDHAYSDSLNGGEYVEFLRERLIIMKELLSESGSIYVHLDGNMAFTMKLIMDEIFGEKNFRAFITRKKCSVKNYTKKTYGNISDYILFYSKTDKYTWNRPIIPWEYDKIIKEYPYIDENSGRRYKKVPIHAPGTRNGETGKEWRGKLPPKGKHWQYTPAKLDELDSKGEIFWSANGNPRRKVFYDTNNGIPIQDIWLKYQDSINQAQMTTGYPTEKNYDMLKMIVEASSNPGDIVLDCFAGSGAMLGAAFESRRLWVGADNGIESVKAILKRFVYGLETYGDYVSGKNQYIQCSIDLYKKCTFDILTIYNNKGELNFLNPS